MTRSGRIWLTIVLLAGLAGVRPTGATLLVPMRDDDLVAISDLIVIGVVTQIETVQLADARVVTRVTLAVERALKGDPGDRTIVITEPGGSIGDLHVVIFGAPEFVRDERTLVFLRVRADGSLSTTALALGKYRLAPENGALRARRDRPTPDVRPAAAFEAQVATLAAGQRGAATNGRRGAAIAPPQQSTVVEAYTFVTSTDGLAARWFEPDCGLEVSFGRANAEASFAPSVSQAAVAEALAAWTNVTGASLTLVQGADVQPAPSTFKGTNDGRNTIQFDDPFGEVGDFTACSGTLALGGFMSSSDAHFGLRKTVGGMTFGRIFEGDVTLNAGLGACFGPATLAEVVGHEVGHTLGFGHSSENPTEPDPTLADALMYYRAHDDGRGASLRADDIAALQAAYPASLVASNDVAAVACEVGIGILGVSCFGGTHLPAAPFTLQKKAKAALDRVATATSISTGKRRRLLKGAKQLLVTAERKAKKIPGACGEEIRARLATLKAHVITVLAGL